MINLQKSRKFLYSLLLGKTEFSGSGFTLTELLVTIIIGGLIVTSVTGFMTDMLRESRREKVRTATQQDMQRALNFIESDLESATYIYTGDEIRNSRDDDGDIQSVASHLDVNENLEIVLAFWKPELIPYTPGGGRIPENCTESSSGDLSIEECENLQTQRRTYTLVVYLQETNPTDTWEGKSTIRRYDLRQFKNEEDSNGFLTLDESPGYVHPTREAEGFGRWPYDINDIDLQSELPKITRNIKTTPVLTDYVDTPTNDPGNLPTCPQQGDNYSRTPSVDQSTSFFACVRQATFEGDFNEGNQDVVIYLRGNPDGRSGYQVAPNSYTPLPTLQTRVMLRGIIDKFMNN